MRRVTACWLPAALFLMLPVSAAELRLFGDADTSGWQYQTFDDITETHYAPATDDSGRRVLAAVSEGGASGFIRRQVIPLYETPWLHFRWRVEQVGGNDNEKKRSGDDFAWRLYFVGKSGLEHRVLNLVYAQNAAVGDNWESPYAGFLRDIRLHAAAAHEDARLGEWQTTTINLGALWRSTFADDGEIGLVGFMTDGDNSGITMRVQYGEIILSASEQL